MRPVHCHWCRFLSRHLPWPLPSLSTSSENVFNIVHVPGGGGVLLVWSTSRPRDRSRHARHNWDTCSFVLRFGGSHIILPPVYFSSYCLLLTRALPTAQQPILPRLSDPVDSPGPCSNYFQPPDRAFLHLRYATFYSPPYVFTFLLGRIHHQKVD